MARLSSAELLPKLVLVVALAAFGRNCTPDCGYTARCVDGVLQTCTVGVDQCVGPQSRHETPCEGLNPACVTIEQDVSAQCAVSATATCTADVCDGHVAERCLFGFHVAEDCAPLGNTCVTTADGKATCALGADAVCGASDAGGRCDGDVLELCTLGYWSRRYDCASAGERCVPPGGPGAPAHCAEAH